MCIGLSYDSFPHDELQHIFHLQELVLICLAFDVLLWLCTASAIYMIKIECQYLGWAMLEVESNNVNARYKCVISVLF